MRDYGTLANALFGLGVGVPGPSLPSNVSWDLRLHGITGRGSTVDPAVRFRLDYENTSAHLHWSMDSGDRSFTANAAGQRAVVAFVGHERNGVFFDSTAEVGNAEED